MKQTKGLGKPNELNLAYDQYIQNNRSIVGLQLEKYSALKKIGEGACGTIYFGLDLVSKIQIAIKVIDLQLIEKEKDPFIKNIKKRLVISQSEIMMRCSSPHLVKCYDILQNKSLKLIFLQLCNGGTLAQEIKRRKTIPESDAIKILKQLLNGLSVNLNLWKEMHSKSVVHRDLKPENILVHNGIYKISDFGFSKALASNDYRNEIKQTNLGTLCTMAPQVIQNRKYGLQADIWSIGVIYYMMLFGTMPFVRSTKKQLITEIRRKRFFEHDYTHPNIEISSQSQSFITQCLTIESQNRLNWKNIANHKIFKKPPEQISLLKSDTESTVQNIDLETEKMQILRSTSIFEPDGLTEQLTQTQEQYIKERLQKRLINSDHFRIVKEHTKIPQKQNSYNWDKNILFQTTRVQLILKEIVDQIQFCSKDFLQKKQVIELLYLILVRCFQDITLENQEIQIKNTSVNKSLIKNANQYSKELAEKLKCYFFKLEEKNNQIFQVVKRKIFCVFQSEKIDERAQYFKSLQSLRQNQKAKNNRKKQIEFTQYLICEILPQIKKQEQISSKAINYLQNYKKICNLTIDEVGDTYLRIYVQNFFTNH